MFYEHDDDLDTGAGPGLGSFILGAIVGAGVALLFAPRSGRETRDQLVHQARSLRSAAESRMREVQASLNDSLHGLRHGDEDGAGAADDLTHQSHGDMERRARDARARRRPPTAPPDVSRTPLDLDDSGEGFGV